MNISQAEISIDKFQREKDLFITLFIVSIQNFKQLLAGIFKYFTLYPG